MSDAKPAAEKGNAAGKVFKVALIVIGVLAALFFGFMGLNILFPMTNTEFAGANNGLHGFNQQIARLSMNASEFIMNTIRLIAPFAIVGLIIYLAVNSFKSKGGDDHGGGGHH